MSRYGYTDMPEGYTDIAVHKVKAACVHCGRRQFERRENCWLENGQMVTDDMCSEYPDGLPDNRQHEW